MVLICDVCHQTIAGTNPTICLFPCFHKYCERCKLQVLSNTRQLNANDSEFHVTCKLCNQQFRSTVLYDYSENQIEKIFCLNCNIKNKAPIEWRCKTCQNRFLCAQCSQPHYHSGHEIEPVMKPSIPFRSQCSLHANFPATYLCSCQTRLCDYCIPIHANGQIMRPHEHRVPFTKLAEQARQELHTIRQQCQTDSDRIQRMKDTIARNKQFVHTTASKARTAVANEVLELVNAVIRRGNDIVTHIDIIEDTKLKQCNQIDQEMRHWIDRLRKIESFAENALLTVQQDDPGMWSASMFVQSAISQVNKRRELAKNGVKMMEQQPNIIYQSNLTELTNALRSFGFVSTDGDSRVPTQSTPQNARMFTIANALPQQNTVNNANTGRIIQPPGGATIRQAMMLPPNSQFAAGQIPKAGATASLISSNSQHGIIQMNPLSQQNINRKALPSIPSTGTSSVAPSISSSSQNGMVLTQLLQQPSILPQSVLLNNSTQPNCSTAPIPMTTPRITQNEQFQMARQNAMLQANRIQQQQNIATNIAIASPTLIQQSRLSQLQSPPLMNINPSQQVFMQLAQQQQHQQQIQQQRLLSPQQSIGSPTSAMFLQQQRQQLLQRPQLMQQQQQPNHNLQIYRLNAPLQRQPSNSEQQNQVTEASNAERPPIVLRISKSKQNLMQHEQQTSVTNAESSTLNQVSNIQTENNNNNTLPVPQNQIVNASLAAPTVAVTVNSPVYQLQQQLSRNNALQQQKPQIQQDNQAQQVSNIVNLVDDEEDIQEITPLQAVSQRTETPVLGKILRAVDNPPVEAQSIYENNSTNISVNSQQQQQQQTASLRQKAQSAAADSTVTLTNNCSNEANDRDSSSPIDSANRLGIAIKRRPQDSSESLMPTHKRAAVENQPLKINDEKEPNETKTSSNADLITTTMMDERLATTSDDDEQPTETNNAMPNMEECMRMKINSEDFQDQDSSEFTRVDKSSDNNEDTQIPVETNHSEITNSQKSDKSGINDNVTEQDAIDWWDDYCYVCSQGCDETTGSLGCCARCPHVFHAKCHVPIINGSMEQQPDDWKCSSCLTCEPLTQASKEFGYREKLLCSKVYLACFQKYSQIEMFLNEVPKTEQDYYSIIKRPICLTEIAQKISTDEYTGISQFIDDMNLLFQNFSTFNPPNNPMAANGKKVFTYFLNAMRKFLPAYEKQIWIYVTLYNPRNTSTSTDDDSTNSRRTKLGRPRRANSSKAKSQTPA